MTVSASTLSSRITEAREAKDLQLPAVARLIGVKTATLKNWEEGRSEPRPNRLCMLAGVLDVSVTWLIGGDEGHAPGPVSNTKADLLAQKLERVNIMQVELSRLIAEISRDVAEIRQLEAQLEELAA